MYLYSNNTPEGSLSERASVLYKHSTIMIGHQEVLPQLASKKVMASRVSRYGDEVLRQGSKNGYKPRGSNL